MLRGLIIAFIWLYIAIFLGGIGIAGIIEDKKYEDGLIKKWVCTVCPIFKIFVVFANINNKNNEKELEKRRSKPNHYLLADLVEETIEQLLKEDKRIFWDFNIETFLYYVYPTFYEILTTFIDNQPLFEDSNLTIEIEALNKKDLKRLSKKYKDFREKFIYLNISYDSIFVKDSLRDIYYRSTDTHIANYIGDIALIIIETPKIFNKKFKTGRFIFDYNHCLRKGFLYKFINNLTYITLETDSSISAGVRDIIFVKENGEKFKNKKVSYDLIADSNKFYNKVSDIFYHAEYTEHGDYDDLSWFNTSYHKPDRDAGSVTTKLYYGDYNERIFLIEYRGYYI